MANGQLLTDYISYGHGAPTLAPSLGVVGQWSLYQNLDTGDYYYWNLLTTAWVHQSSVGPTGATGSAGATGPSGPTGPTGTAAPYIQIANAPTSGTDGGTFTSGAWRIRTLDTIQSDASGLTTLSSNQFTLPAGTYILQASAPALQVNDHMIRLYNVTDSAVTAYGTTEWVGNPTLGNSAQTRSRVNVRFTLTGTKTFRIEHYCTATVTTVGFGNSLGLAGVNELYTQVQVWKMA